MRQFFSSLINRIAYKELENSGYKAITSTIKEFRLLRGTKANKEHINPPPRQRISLSKTPQTIYAIGDVHGCLKSLKKLEQLVLNDKVQHPGNALLVMLGDYVDRGPDTRGVINHFLRPLADDIKRLCLVGNHEIMMLQAINDPKLFRQWLSAGGKSTVQSYDLDIDYLLRTRAMKLTDLHAAFLSALPAEHISFMEKLPILLQTPQYLFCHAGLRPDISLDQQTDHDITTIREPFLSHTQKITQCQIIHGHTPVREPVINDVRIGIDTAAVHGGSLTAVRLDENGVQLFSVDSTTD